MDQPSKPCLMASESSDDGPESHPTPSMMPPLASEAIEVVNFCCGADGTASVAAQKWGIGTLERLFSMM
jgi:hypothetical protein